MTFPTLLEALSSDNCIFLFQEMSCVARKSVYENKDADMHAHYEPRREKTGLCICKNKDADQLCSKFQASSHLLWMYSQFCVGPGQKPQRQVFS